MVVVTDDLGMRLKCEGRVGVAQPPSQRLPDPASEDRKRRQQAEAALAELKNRRAQLRVKATLNPDGGEPSERVSADLMKPEPIDKEAELRRLREEFRPLVAPARSPFDLAGMSLTPRLADYQVELYNDELEEFFKNSKDYFEALAQDLNLFGLRRLSVSLWLLNSGSLRAEEIDVLLAVKHPPISAVCEADIDFYERQGWEPLPEPPKPPRKPKPKSPLALQEFHMPTIDFGPRVLPRVTSEAPRTQEGRIEWRISVRHLRHNDRIELGSYVFLLDSNEWGGFSVDYEIRDTTNPKPQTGSVVFDRSGK